jgi:hypothetical protein
MMVMMNEFRTFCATAMERQEERQGKAMEAAALMQHELLKQLQLKK